MEQEMKERNWLDLVRPTSFDRTETGSLTTIVVEPLERGFGFTLGTALRRVLLSSIAGAAVTGVRMAQPAADGAIEGIEEPAEILILNLKQLAFRADEAFQSARIVLDLARDGLVTAADLDVPEGLEIVDPEQPVCTVRGGARIRIELMVAKGRGYVPAALQPAAHLPEGFTAVDALHSPVRRVTCTVDPTRLGQVLDYDRLTLGIETDSTIDGEAAVSHAARILHDQLSGFINFVEEAPVKVEEAPDPLGFNPILLRHVEELELSVRSSNCMKHENIVYIGDLVTHSEAQMLRVPNFGRKSLNEIKGALAAMGLSLGMEVPGWPPQDVEALSKRYLD